MSACVCARPLQLEAGRITQAEYDELTGGISDDDIAGAIDEEVRLGLRRAVAQAEAQATVGVVSVTARAVFLLLPSSICFRRQEYEKELAQKTAEPMSADAAKSPEDRLEPATAGLLRRHARTVPPTAAARSLTQ